MPYDKCVCYCLLLTYLFIYSIYTINSYRLGLLCLLTLGLGLAWVLSYITTPTNGWGLTGVWLGMTLGACVYSICMWILVYNLNWMDEKDLTKLRKKVDSVYFTIANTNATDSSSSSSYSSAVGAGRGKKKRLSRTKKDNNIDNNNDNNNTASAITNIHPFVNNILNKLPFNSTTASNNNNNKNKFTTYRPDGISYNYGDEEDDSSSDNNSSNNNSNNSLSDYDYHMNDKCSDNED